mgnify:CR=1 FL=1|tara:strand:+ start:98 stop:322 length:225 start_codon:yes stop_codon:yes gene_type:complete
MTLDWISVVEKNEGFYIKIDPAWVSYRDQGENILTVWLSDDVSGDPRTGYPIVYTVNFIRYDMVGVIDTNIELL